MTQIATAIVPAAAIIISLITFILGQRRQNLNDLEKEVTRLTSENVSLRQDNLRYMTAYFQIAEDMRRRGIQPPQP